ncbi:hypothetical protein F4814DRAFT_423720 [Daldinia grandis]|nr:hypothetical protein F4814DRAFT_423720 [Daldinia grandis]
MSLFFRGMICHVFLVAGCYCFAVVGCGNSVQLRQHTRYLDQVGIRAGRRWVWLSRTCFGSVEALTPRHLRYLAILKSNVCFSRQ